MQLLSKALAFLSHVYCDPIATVSLLCTEQHSIWVQLGAKEEQGVGRGIAGIHCMWMMTDQIARQAHLSVA